VRWNLNNNIRSGLRQSKGTSYKRTSEGSGQNEKNSSGQVSQNESKAVRHWSSLQRTDQPANKVRGMPGETHLCGVVFTSVIFWILWKKSGCQGATSVLYVLLNCKKVSCLQSRQTASIEKGCLGRGFCTLVKCKGQLGSLSKQHERVEGHCHSGSPTNAFCHSSTSRELQRMVPRLSISIKVQSQALEGPVVCSNDHVLSSMIGAMLLKLTRTKRQLTRPSVSAHRRRSSSLP
jgi:hypothetical protein